MSEKTLKVFIIIFIFFAVALLVPHLPGFDYDTLCWREWAQHNFKSGLRNAYLSGSDYLPVYHYVLYGFGQIMGSVDKIYENINYLRLLTLSLDIVGLYYVYKWIDKKIDFLLFVIFNILNVAYTYNTVVWGQIDAIVSMLVFLSAYFAYKQKIVLSSVYYILALNLKLQAIIFLPLWGMLYLLNGINKRDWKSFAYPILAMAVIQFALVIPFHFAEREGLGAVWNVVINSAQRHPRVSVNAFNFWHWVCDAWNTKDTEIFVAGISYHTAGLILFCSSSFLVMLPMLRKFFSNLGKKHPASVFPEKDVLWLIFALIPLLFFFFCTQMHERYSHPAFIFIVAYSFYAKDFIPYALFSTAYFLNLEKASELLHVNNYDTFIFDTRFIAALFALTIIYLGVKLFKLSRRPATEHLADNEGKLPYHNTADRKATYAGAK